MIIVNPSLNDFVNLAAGVVELREVDPGRPRWEFVANSISLTIPSTVGDRFQMQAARAAMLVLAYYWSGLDSSGQRPDMLRKDVIEISQALNKWTENVIKSLSRQVVVGGTPTIEVGVADNPDEDVQEIWSSEE